MSVWNSVPDKLSHIASGQGCSLGEHKRPELLSGIPDPWKTDPQTFSVSGQGHEHSCSLMGSQNLNLPNQHLSPVLVKSSETTNFGNESENPDNST